MDRRMEGSSGATLLEVVIALSIAAVIGIFSISFLMGQMKLYHQYDKKMQAMRICSGAYDRLEKKICFGYGFHVDPSRPQELTFSVKTEGLPVYENGRGIRRSRKAEARECIKAEDLEAENQGDMKLELDFSGTSGERVKVVIRVMEDGKEICCREAELSSMYSTHSAREGTDEEWEEE